MKFIVYQGYEEKYRFRLVDDSENIISSSRLYDTEDEAIEAAVELNPSIDIDNRVAQEEDAE